MRALVLPDHESAPALADLPIPEPGPGEVRLHVKAAGLNRIDSVISAGMLKGTAEYRFPVVLGRDAAGIVDAVGKGTGHVAVGDEVVGHVPLDGDLRHGTIAERAVLPAETVATKPAQLDFVEAAAVPLAGVTALACVDAVAPVRDATVLIVGASGGVGSFATQLAALAGADVIATGLPDDAERLHRLGAAQVVDFREDVVAQVSESHDSGIDGLIDLVSTDADRLGHLASIVRDGSRIASTLGAADAEALSAQGLTGANIHATPNRVTLARLAAEIRRSDLQVDVQATLSLAEATTGLEALADGRARGKIVVEVD